MMKHVGFIRTVRVPEYKPRYSLVLFNEITFGCTVKVLCDISNKLLKKFTYEAKTHSIVSAKCIEFDIFSDRYIEYIKDVSKSFFELELPIDVWWSLDRFITIDIINEVSETDIIMLSGGKTIELKVKNKYSIDEKKKIIQEVKQDEIKRVSFGLGGGYARGDVKFKEIVKFKKFSEMYEFFEKRKI